MNYTTEQLTERRRQMETRGKDAWRPLEQRSRSVSSALRAYALLTTSADKGAVRDVGKFRD